MPYLSPPSLTKAEQQALLEASSSHPRDHLIFSLALGTGLRLSEIIGLDVGDVYFPDGKPRGRVRLRREIAKGGRVGDVFLPDALAPKLATFWGYKLRSDESIAPDAPLLCNQAQQRLSKRRLQTIFKHWQREAGFDRFYPVHALRHYAELGIIVTPRSQTCGGPATTSSLPRDSPVTSAR